ncbi:hypothetical protein BLNAU_12214 [Blattamonas nauphoetae]|uniref:Protein kinase domain-containing protein n=1 Tax=Blattamonas nauphoetae TaxID=2049346 RepID=A0ABQ9XNH9_9EUKA|nr:hypothetical protein BLNAU_12214 [Blattamonas nauphoetae]
MLCDVTHHSRSDSIAPFVGLAHPHSSLVSSASADLSDLRAAEMEGIAVIGTGLSLESKDLVFGTGPLFSFGMNEQECSLGSSGCALRMETDLLSSTLVDVTSSSAFSSGKQQFGSEVSQLVIGSCVRQSTNHDSGTGMMSPNLGGNLLCLNTSFSSCIRQTNADLEISFENRTQTSNPGRFSTIPAGTPSVTFTLCTFNTMTVAAGSNNGGAAIYFVFSSSLTVQACFFHKCSCTGSDADGGAIHCTFSSYFRYPLSIHDSSFTNCSSSDCGGSIQSSWTTEILVDGCFFEKSKAARLGTLNINSHHVNIANTVFVDCSAGSQGGGMYISGTPTSISLSSVRFRGCSSPEYPNSRDIALTIYSDQFSADRFVSCDSTSGSPNIYFYGDYVPDSTLVPQIPLTASTEIKSVDVAIDGDEATVRVFTTNSIKGTMAVLLDGSNVPRFVHVVFGDDTTTSNLGTGVVSSGPNGILPEADYVFRSAAVKGYRLESSIGPFIFEASSTLDGLSSAEIVVSGANLKEGSYWMVIAKGGKEWNIPLTLLNSTTLTGTAPLDSTPGDGTLEWSTEYEVTKVMWDGGEEPEKDITLRESLTLTTPAEPPRITAVDCALNGKKDVVIVKLTGRSLTSDGQTLVVVSQTSNEMVSSGELFNVTSTKCFVNFPIAESESNTHVVFGGTYDLKSFESDSSSILVDSGLFFEVPHPPRITSLKPDTEVNSSTFVLAVSGENLPSGKTFIVTLTSGPSFTVSFSSTSGGTSTIGIGGCGQLQYNTDYTIQSVTRKVDGEDDHILLSSSSFKTPLGPTLSSVSCDFSSSNPNFLNLTLSTQRMPLEDFTLTLKSSESPPATLSLTITSSDLSTGFVLVEVYNKTGTLKYGTTYSIDGMNSSSVVAVVTALPFTTKPEPIRITSAGCSLKDDKQKSAVVTLNGVKLGGERRFSIGVRKMEGSTLIGDEIELSGTLSGESSSTTYTHTELIFGNAEPHLSYNTKYAITRFNVEDSISVVDANVTFSVPAEPARLTSVLSLLQYSSDSKIATISLSGIGMEGDYNLTLSVDSSETDNVTLTATFDSDGSGTLTAVLFDSSDPSTVDLSYNTRYEVVDVTLGPDSMFFESGLVFTTMPVPPRLLSISVGDSTVALDFVELSFGSIALPSEATFTLTLESVHSDGTTPHQKVINLKTDPSGQLALHQAQLYPFETETEKKKGQLEYGTEYKVVSFQSGDTTILFEDSTTRIQTPMEPARIVRIKTRELNNVRTKMIVSLDGRALLSRTGKVSLTDGSSIWESLSDVTIVDDTHCTAEFAVGKEETSEMLKCGKRYTLTGSWSELSGFLVEDGIDVVVPFLWTITNMKFNFSNTLHTVCFVNLTGTDLIVGESLNVTLNSSFSFIATITSETEAQSTELLIGWPTTLQHNTEYTITSVEATDADLGKPIFASGISDTTGSKCNPFVIFVDSGLSSDSTLFCGDLERPCSSIEDGWKIVEGIGISSLSMSIVHNTTQNEQVRMMSGHEVVIGSLPTTKPELFVSPPSLSEMEGEGMVEVVGGRLRLRDVDVVLSDPPSLIFIRMSGGAIVLEEATTAITSSTFSELPFGAINLKGGNLTIQGSIFESNNPQLSGFPSFRRNIRCSGEGHVKIGSLNGGDGSSEKHPHLWLSHDDCVLSGEDVNVNAPFFIPTLSSSSTTTLNKTSQAFDLTMKGSTLIPCSLILEVFEKKKDGSVGKTVRIPLSVDSVKSFNETRIEMSLAVSSLSGLEKSLEWSGRVVYGLNESTTSFVIQKNSVDRAAQAVIENIKWWIPVLASLVFLLILIVIVIIVCWRRRKNNKKSEMHVPQELDEEDEARICLDQKMDETIAGNSDDCLIKSQQTVNPNMNHPDPTSTSAPIGGVHFVEVLGETGEVELVDLMKADTLFDVLHRPEKQKAIYKKELSRKMAKGLIRIVKDYKTSGIITRFSPHWVLVNNSVVQLRLGTIDENTLEGHRTQNDSKQGPIVGDEAKGSFFGGRLSAAKSETTEGQRWRAPEASRSNVEKIDIESALVFSLGLVLWEVWTGEVPWKEMDEANAARQNEGGVQPNLKLVLDTSIRELISRCLSFDPKERPSLQDVFDGLTGSEWKMPEQPSHVANTSDALDVHS